MKAKLIYELPTEQYEHHCAVNGMGFRDVISRVDAECRGKLKYGHEFLSVNDALIWVRDLIREGLDNVEVKE
jgi:hypothetical protein